MTRPTDWSPLGYGSDPVPGDPDHVDLVGRMYVGTADSIVRAAENLRTALADNFDLSEAVDAVREVAGDVADRISRAEERYRGVGDAMIAYAPHLRTAQTDSAAALQQAIDAQSSAGTARTQVDALDRQIADPNTPPANLPALQERRSTWSGRLDTASGSLETARGQLADAISARDSFAEIAVTAVREVESSGDLNDSWWDNVVQWVHENKELLDLIVEIAGYVATAVMVVALFIPGLNVIVGVIATIAAVITVANAALQFAAGTMGPVEALLNVGLAALTFVGGRAISSATTRLANSAQTTVATSVRTSYAGAGIRGMTQANALQRVTTVVNVSRPQQLAMLDRLRFAALDYRSASAIRNLANLELISGTMSPAQRQILVQLNQLATRGLALEAGGQVAGRGIGAIGRVEKPLPWRLGNNW